MHLTPKRPILNLKEHREEWVVKYLYSLWSLLRLLPVSSAMRTLMFSRNTVSSSVTLQKVKSSTKKVVQSPSVRGRKLVKMLLSLSHRRSRVQRGDDVPLVFTCVSGLLVSVPTEFPTLYFSRGREFPGMICIVRERNVSLKLLCHKTLIGFALFSLRIKKIYRRNSSVLSLTHTYCVNGLTKTTCQH